MRRHKANQMKETTMKGVLIGGKADGIEVDDISPHVIATGVDLQYRYTKKAGTTDPVQYYMTGFRLGESLNPFHRLLPKEWRLPQFTLFISVN